RRGVVVEEIEGAEARHDIAAEFGAGAGATQEKRYGKAPGEYCPGEPPPHPYPRSHHHERRIFRCLDRLASRKLYQRKYLSRSVAPTSWTRMPGSIAEWPASGTTMYSAPGQARASSSALTIGQTMS